MYAHPGTQLTLAECHNKLDEFVALEFNWDWYGADPISVTALDVFMQLLSTVRVLPFYVTPVADGSVLLTWSVGTKNLEVDVNPDGLFGYLLEDYTGDTRISDEKNGLTYPEILDLIGRVVDSA